MSIRWTKDSAMYRSNSQQNFRTQLRSDGMQLGSMLVRFFIFDLKYGRLNPKPSCQWQSYFGKSTLRKLYILKVSPLVSRQFQKNIWKITRYSSYRFRCSIMRINLNGDGAKDTVKSIMKIQDRILSGIFKIQYTILRIVSCTTLRMG